VQSSLTELYIVRIMGQTTILADVEEWLAAFTTHTFSKQIPDEYIL